MHIYDIFEIWQMFSVRLIGLQPKPPFVSSAFDVCGLFWRREFICYFRDVIHIQVPFFLYTATSCMEIYWVGETEGGGQAVAVVCRLKNGEKIWNEKLHVITNVMMAVYRYLSCWILFVPGELHDSSIHRWNRSLMLCITICNTAPVLFQFPSALQQTVAST